MCRYADGPDDPRYACDCHLTAEADDPEGVVCENCGEEMAECECPDLSRIIETAPSLTQTAKEETKS